MVAKMEQYRESPKPVEKAPVVKGSLPNPLKVSDPSTMRVNMQQHDLGNVTVGKTMKMVVHGKITAHNQDKYGHTVHLDVHKIESAEPRGGGNRDRS